MSDNQQPSQGDISYVRVRAHGMGAPSAAQLDAITARVADPSILSEHPPFVWRVVASTDAIDSYFTRMDESSLRNYAEDARAGIAYLDSHNHRELPLGTSFDGRYIRGQGGGAAGARVEEDFFTLQGLTRGSGLSADELVNLLRAGIARDVSIGFYGGWYRCSICDRDMFPGFYAKAFDDDACPHFPGVVYPETDRKGQETGEQVTAYAWVMDAHQVECSSVYEGACPGAMVTKAHALASAGVLKTDTIHLLESRLRIRIGGASQTLRGWESTRDSETEGTTMGENEREPAVAAESAAEPLANESEASTEETVMETNDAERIAATLARAGAPDGATLDWLADEIQRLRPAADDGRVYRAALIDEALSEGVRALGESFPVEQQRALLQAQPLDMIRVARDTWRATGDARFSGGRSTVDDETPKQTESPASERRPDLAYVS